MVDLTVIIVTFNSAEHLAACAAALGPALAGLAARVVVVDSASADASVAEARVYWPAALMIERPVNGGFAAAVNAGLAVAEGRAVLLLNPDAAPEPGSIAALLAHPAEPAARPLPTGDARPGGAGAGAGRVGAGRLPAGATDDA
jgi:GT2 family glycosyltransferase